MQKAEPSLEFGHFQAAAEHRWGMLQLSRRAKLAWKAEPASKIDARRGQPLPIQSVPRSAVSSQQCPAQGWLAVFPQSEIRNLQNKPMSIRTMTTGQEKRKSIPMPTGFNVGSMIWVAIRSNTSRYGPIPTRKAAPLIKRNNLPTFCTVVSGIWFTSAIQQNSRLLWGLAVRQPEYQYRLVRGGLMELTPPHDPRGSLGRSPGKDVFR